ncbi:MAG: helix-turn-helix domain-containing protein [Lachnospiraceae bacterium]|nr:helix-turn-helix domain-containing protein [Lachnospiraceae bacterium]
MEKERLSEIIKEYRRKHYLSQAEFAHKAGVSPTYISVLEREKDPNTGLPTKPKMETYALLAGAMGISRDKLIARVEGKEMFESTFKMECFSVQIVSRLDDFDMSLSEIARNNKDNIYHIPAELYKVWRTLAFVMSYDDYGQGVFKGDIAITWLDEELRNGDYVVAANRDGELGINRVFRDNNGILLYGSLNEEPYRYKEDDDNMSVRVLGRVVQIRRQFRGKN